MFKVPKLQTDTVDWTYVSDSYTFVHKQDYKIHLHKVVHKPWSRRNNVLPLRQKQEVFFWYNCNLLIEILVPQILALHNIYLTSWNLDSKVFKISAYIVVSPSLLGVGAF